MKKYLKCLHEVQKCSEKMSDEILMKLIRRLQKYFEIAVARSFAECIRFFVIVI